jgi:hypothetical protein
MLRSLFPAFLSGLMILVGCAPESTLPSATTPTGVRPTPTQSPTLTPPEMPTATQTVQPTPEPTATTALPETHAGVPETIDGWPHLSLDQIPPVVRHFRAQVQSQSPFDEASPSVVVNAISPGDRLIVICPEVDPCIVNLASFSIIDQPSGIENFFVIRAINNAANTNDANEKVVVLATWIGQNPAEGVSSYTAQRGLDSIHTTGGRHWFEMITMPGINTEGVSLVNEWFSDSTYVNKLMAMHDSGILQNIDEPVVGFTNGLPLPP